MRQMFTGQCEQCKQPFEKFRRGNQPYRFCSLSCSSIATNRAREKSPEDKVHTRAAASRRWRQRHPEYVSTRRTRRVERDRDKIRMRPPLSDEEKQTIEMFYGQGFSFKQIAVKLSPRTGNTIANYLRTKFTIRPRPVPRGAKSHGWRGGRWKDQHGYWYIRIPSTDPLIEMGGKAGIAYEHRLVMARSLGRPLLPTESVHHVNGEPADNRLENLQLRQGKHGKHIVMACRDCGSHRVGPVEIMTLTED